MKNMCTQALISAFAMLSIPEETSAQTVTISPSLIFENQAFKVDLVISPACNEGVSSIQKSVSHSVVRYEVDLIGSRIEQCADISPAIPGKVTYYSDIIEGMARGTNYVDLEYYINTVNGRTSTRSTRTIVNVQGTEGYEGSGALHHNLESPRDGETVSGINLIRGWACYESPITVNAVQYQIDNGPLIEIPYGSTRPDTNSICDGKEENGFGATVNWGAYSLGHHTLKLFINGKMTSEHNFEVAGLGQEFARGISRSFILNDFPEPGKNATIEWSEALQNFLIIEAK
ncbi:hypothetical protein [Pseudoteredinibacter isoporae]|uniref:hypothetical protein n=1 Tax=Pseudoteredinibacter isoporae TaxID=570281 RepID=UPI00333E3C9C